MRPERASAGGGDEAGEVGRSWTDWAAMLCQDSRFSVGGLSEQIEDVQTYSKIQRSKRW